MFKSVIYLDEACEEYFAALRYYLDKSTNAAVGFESAVETVEEILLLFPQAGQRLDSNNEILHFGIPKYPYELYYRIDDDNLEIVAISLFNTNKDSKKLEDIIISRIEHKNNG